MIKRLLSDSSRGSPVEIAEIAEVKGLPGGKFGKSHNFNTTPLLCFRVRF
jgi:hypothetical protein